MGHLSPQPCLSHHIKPNFFEGTKTMKSIITIAASAFLFASIASQAQAQPGYPNWEAVRAAAALNGGGSAALLSAPKTSLTAASHLLATKK